MKLGLTLRAPETGFLRASVDKGEVFSSKNPVSLVPCVSSVKYKTSTTSNDFYPSLHNIEISTMR
jgi:hypothetical protein